MKVLLMALALSVVLAVCMMPDITESTTETDNAMDIVYVGESPLGHVYRIDMANGPLYFCEYETEHGIQTRILSQTSMTLDIDFQSN